MSSISHNDLVEQIYAAAIDRTRWPAVVEAVTDAVGGWRSCFTQLSTATAASVESFSVRSDPAWTDAYHQHFHAVNTFGIAADPAAYARSWRPTLLTDEDCLPRDEYLRSEFFNAFMRPQDLDRTLFLRLGVSRDDETCINISRSIRDGAFERSHLDAAARLQPHLVRAYSLGRSLSGALGLVHDALETLDLSGNAVILLDGLGVIRHSNAAAERLLGEADALTVANGRLVARHPDEGRALQRLVGLAVCGAPRVGGSLSLTGERRRLPLSVRVAPISARPLAALSSPPSAIVTVTDLDVGVRSPEEELRTLFGLTAAEARTATAVFDGLSLPEAAERFGVSLHTVRFQLYRVFEKTGVTRQVELVKLMMRLSGGRHDG